jgi:crotonobetainyl-CoA:carnitine CoA-transferase CaiB-like acyl-CoA transferase
VGGPLDGVLVLDLSDGLAGPHAAMLLGDLGARVIKIEVPEGGDQARSKGPVFVPGDDGELHSTLFLACNRNKESIVLDLQVDGGRATLRELVHRADVVVADLPADDLPADARRPGCDATSLHEVNPRLVILSITGYGHDGADSARIADDRILQGEAGLMSLTGRSAEEPVAVGVPIAEVLAATNGAYGVVAALYERRDTGRGRIVRTSLLAAVVGAHADRGTRHTVASRTPRGLGELDPSSCPSGLFPSSDGLVQIAVNSEPSWRAFAVAFGVDRPEWLTNADRVLARTAVDAAVADAFVASTTDVLIDRLTAQGIAAGRVRDLGQVYDWKQTRSQGLLIEVEHAALGPITLPGPAVRLDDHTYAGGRATNLAPPLLDEHGHAIRAWLGGNT